MKTIRTNYDGTISMTCDRWDAWVESKQPMQVLASDRETVVGHLLPGTEGKIKEGRGGHLIVVAPFRKWESEENKAERLARVEAYKKLKGIA